LRIYISAFLAAPFLATLAGSIAIADGEIPTPSVDRIDYSHPENYTDISPAFGDVAEIRKFGESVRSGTPRRSIAAILKWMGKNLRYDPNVPDIVRNFDAIVKSKVYGGCAEHSVVFAALAKACGIPTVTVKTIAANSPTCQVLANRAVQQGYMPRMTFNTQYEIYLAKARGKILIETCVGRQICPPAAKYANYLPLNEEAIKGQIDGGKSGIVRKKLPDGTRAVLIYAPDLPKLHELIQTLEIWPAP
jgi:hypothetical protein